MSDVQFQTIGAGFMKMGDDNKLKSINLKLDANAYSTISQIDFEKGIYLFPKVSKAGKKYFSVAAPMPAEYQQTPMGQQPQPVKQIVKLPPTPEVEDAGSEDIPF